MRRLAIIAVALACMAADPDPIIRTGYQLTARPWHPLNITADRYLDAIEGLCRFSVRHQNAEGAIVDPLLHREHQYATPYFAYALGTLVSAGRARDLLPAGIRAMDHATANFAGGAAHIPDQHGEFFIPALTEALDVYASLVPASNLAIWRERLRKPRAEVMHGPQNNWETYAMKGEWLRSQGGLVDRSAAVGFIEHAWQARQHDRIGTAPWFLYHDRTSDPDTLSVEAVGRGNLLALVLDGYNGPSAAEMRRLAEAGTRMTLDLQDPSGQVPANGRTDDHVWVEVGYQLAFEAMAARTLESGDKALAGQFHHASQLAFQSIQRWRRTDGEWSGTYYITKNHFDPDLRVGYQEASQYSNYSGSLMFHLAEAWRICRSVDGKGLTEAPAPAEIGGYAIALDSQLASTFANAGGMQIQVNLRGQVGASSGNLWTPLGVVRFARANWETRLGPSDGALTATGGVTFAPEFFEDGRWLRMADLSARYEGRWSVQFVHPLLVRCAVDYQPKPGMRGPTFRDEFVVTPDGVLSTVIKTSADATKWAVTWPLLENDGAPLVRTSGDNIRSVKYPAAPDQQNFIALNQCRISEEPLLRSTYGDLRPVRVEPDGTAQRTFIYPQGAGDPTAKGVHDSLVITTKGMRSALGRIRGTTYAGRTVAGGVAKEIDLDGDGIPDATFSETCGFIVQLRNGKPAAVETDQDVDAVIQGRKVHLLKHQPRSL